MAECKNVNECPLYQEWNVVGWCFLGAFFKKLIPVFPHHWCRLTRRSASLSTCQAAAGRTATSATTWAALAPAGGSSLRWRWRWRAWPPRPARTAEPGNNAPSSTPDPPRRPPAPPRSGAATAGPARAQAPEWAAGPTPTLPYWPTARRLARCRTGCLLRLEASCPAAGGWHTVRLRRLISL